ncbi:MAG: hypothetical protein AMS14_04155 [Planctomycetes bacterium DG_20]|nr:MAG: hypothetical protein AMS14_04155 [Planctomycetes bacterium DG_20]
MALKAEAFEVGRQLIEDFPQDPEAMALMASVCNQYDQTAEAVTWWQKCLERNPRHAGAYHGLGTVALTKGENEKAAELWRKAQEADPDLPGAYRGCAVALLLSGNPDQAIVELEKEMKLSPGRREDYVLLGQAHLQLQAYEKAVENYEKAIAIRPDPTACYGLATAYARLGRHDKAAEYRARFEQVEAKQDRLFGAGDRTADNRAVAVQILIRTHAGAGRMYYARGRLEQAERHGRRVAALDPKDQASRQVLVDLYTRAGRAQEALEMCRQLQEIDPANPTYHLNAGFVLGRLGQSDAAEEAVWKGIRLAPAQPTGYRALVQVLLLANRHLSQAGAAARKLVELEPTAGNLTLLGEVYLRTGDLAGARAALKQACELEPGNETLRKAYERLQPGE